MSGTYEAAFRRMQTWRAMRAFLGAEVVKMRHMRTTKVAVVSMCVTSPVLIGVVWVMGSDTSLFPGVVQVIGAALWLLTGLTTVLLTSGYVGAEFDLGTARVIVGRGTHRWMFIIGKAIVALAVSVCNALLAWFCGGVAAIISHLSQVGTEGLGDGIRALLSWGLGSVAIVTLSSAAYIGVAMAIGVITRSAALTLLGALGVVVADFSLGEFSWLPAAQRAQTDVLSIFSATDLLLSQFPLAMGANWSMSTGSATRPSAALLTLTCYALGGIAVACALFQRQDLAGR